MKRNLTQGERMAGSIFIIFILFLFGEVMYVPAIIIAICFFIFSKKIKVADIEKTKESKQDQLKEEARALIEKIQTEKKLEPVKTSLFLEKDENAFLSEYTTLMETKAVRKTSGGGVGFRLMKGVYVGGHQGHSESHQELRNIDTGDLIVTNKRFVFRGATENRIFPLSKVVDVKMLPNGIEVAVTGRQKSLIFPLDNPYIWNLTMFILNRVENPLDFSGIEKIDISID